MLVVEEKMGGTLPASFPSRSGVEINYKLVQSANLVVKTGATYYRAETLPATTIYEGTTILATLSRNHREYVYAVIDCQPYTFQAG